MDKKEGKKLAILLFDGWSLLPRRSSFIFHLDNNFFNDLYAQNRSLAIAKDPDHQIEKTFFSGNQIPLNKQLIRDLGQKSQFWQNPQITKMTDSIRRSGGRLWFLATDVDDCLKQIIQDSRQNAINKVGLFSAEEPTIDRRPHRLTADVLLASANRPQNFKIQPEDGVIYWTDISRTAQFKKYLNRQKYQPLRQLTLTDENNASFDDTIINNRSTDFRQIITNAGHNLYQSNCSQSLSDIPLEANCIILALDENYFSVNLDFPIIHQRREKLIDLIEQLISAKQFTIIITSRWGLDKNSPSIELLPFIFYDDQFSRQTTKSPIEEYLASDYDLSNIGPTILDYLDIEKPPEMTAKSMLKSLYPERYVGNHQYIGFRRPAISSRSLF